MKNVLKAIGIFVAVMAAVVGALAIYDRYSNRNKLEGDYLVCDVPEDEAA